jgi:hypothetical protein
MKKQQVKKLCLSKETIGNLDRRGLTAAVGGTGHTFDTTCPCFVGTWCICTEGSCLEGSNCAC